jgi:ligand-binding sensor domain-containing protein
LAKKSKGKLIAIGVGIVVAVGIGIAITLGTQGSDAGSSSDSQRVVFWRHVHGLGIDPLDKNILYIATHGDFYKSVNGEPPVKVDQQRADYMAFNAPPTEGVPLYASGHPSTGGNMGLVKSTDGGQTWQSVSQVLDPPVDFHAMAVSMSNSNVIMGFDSGGRGLFKTTDAGNTWQSLNYPEYITALAIAPDNSEEVFAGTENGIFRSSDGGSSWTQLNQYKGIGIFALVFDLEGALYASTETFGLSKSSDQGGTWQNIERPNTLTINSIAADSENKIIYVAGFSPDGFQEVYKGSFDGSNWQLLGTNEEQL